MEILGHFYEENYAWRLSIVQNFVNIADFYCVIFGPKWPTTPSSHTVLKYCKKRGLTNKSDHGGGKEKYLLYPMV